ncbi:copper-binding protein [Alteromonas mediterranea]|uniref:copper-binding protein n=1 Tax=Alteromonas mediterranea TaxID=314275 RepID=UPI002FE01168
MKLGQSDSRHFEVLEGVLPGDEVVVSAQFLIDSESSKNSDFTRMKAPNHQATTTGTIEAIKRPDAQSADNVEMTIARGPIEKWGRGPAVMDFAVSQHIDVSNFNVGDSVVFTFVTGKNSPLLTCAAEQSRQLCRVIPCPMKCVTVSMTQQASITVKVAHKARAIATPRQ